MIRGLVIYASFVGIAVTAISITMRVPFDTALGVFAIGALGVLSVATPALIVRNLPKRKPRRAEYLGGCDPVAPALPPVRVTAELVQPERRRIRVEPRLQIEAPRREIEAPQ